MTPKSTQSVIDELLNNPLLYEEKAAQENQFWGETFSDEKEIQVREADKAAGRELRVARDKLRMAGAIRRQGLQLRRGLSLACGSGRAERMALGQGICTSFHGIDVAEDAIQEARKMAAQVNLDITYECGDLNAIRLEPASFDLVVTQNCLHHVLQLEHLAAEIHKTLTPNGVLWIHDYVGETQFQYSDKRLEIANAVLKLLPEKLRTDRVNGSIITSVNRPIPGEMPSPFEAIRSAEIMPVFLKHFDILEKHENGGIMRLVIPLGAKGDYIENEDTRALFELLFYLDETLIREGILEPAGIQ
ncbi:MAG TPA: class I SAM-dependent methyltransferase, partial [Halioglobus sp.]